MDHGSLRRSREIGKTVPPNPPEAECPSGGLLMGPDALPPFAAGLF